MTKKILTIYHHKTEKNMGTKSIKISDELHEIIKNFHQKSGSKYLICTASKYKFEQANMSMFMKTHLGNIGSSMIRKIYVSDKVIKEGIEYNKKKEIAQIMGHSISTQHCIYGKFADYAELARENERLKQENDQLKYELSKHEP